MDCREIVMTSSLQGPRLYLNEGKFLSGDVTKASGLSNAERVVDHRRHARRRERRRTVGHLYLSCWQTATPGTAPNELWINQGVDAHGVPTFRERAREYGIEDGGYSTQAVFFELTTRW